MGSKAIESATGLLNIIVYGANVAAHGSGTYGLWSIGVQAFRLASNLLPFATVLHGVLTASPAPAMLALTDLVPIVFALHNAPSTPGIAGPLSAACCAFLSVLGCLLGRR
jgi:hypothetical protein